MSKSIVRIVFAVLISVGAIAMAASTSVQAKVKTILQKPGASMSASVSAKDQAFGKASGRDRYQFQNEFGSGEGHDCGSDPTSDY